MKVFALIAKIVIAVAAIAGIIYLVATYGDRLIAWAKKTIAKMKRPKAEFFDEDFCDDISIDDDMAEDTGLEF